MVKTDNMDTEKIIEEALKEDLGTGDITTDAILTEDRAVKARIISKADGILSGISIAKQVFKKIDKNITFTAKKQDSNPIEKGELIAEIAGSAKSIMKAERVALNILGRMSGIATATNEYQENCKKASILDTRKTTPLLRHLEKYSVKCGGGKNHRIGLYDMILIKDNHIKAAGSVAEALRRAKKATTDMKMKGIKIEIECETLNEVREAIETESIIPDIIMLDNMDEKTMKEAIKIIKNKAKTEASGNMTLERIKKVDALGVDYISVGAITHSAKNHDFSLKIKD